MAGLLPAAVVASVPPDNGVGIGTVTAVHPVTGRPTVVYRGTELQHVGIGGGYQPSPGDTVVLVRQDSSWLLLGRVDSGSAPSSGLAVLNTVPPGQQFTTAGYTNVTVGALPFRKARAGSRLLVRVEGSGWATSGQPLLVIAVRFSTVDHEVTRFLYNSTFEHKSWSGSRLIAGEPAGPLTAQVRARVNSAVVQVDTNDSLSLTVQEVGG